MNFARACLCVVLLSVNAGIATAQFEPRLEPSRYVPFPVDPNFETLLKQRLDAEKDLEPLKQLMAKIAANPKNLNEAALAALLKDPELQDKLRKLKEQHPGVWRTFTENHKRGIANLPTSDLQKQLKMFLEQPETMALLGGAPPVPAAKQATPKKLADDPLAKLTERVIKNAEDSHLGDWLRESPAWQRAFADLQQSLKKPDVDAVKSNTWSEKFGLPKLNSWELAKKAWDKMRELPPPDLQNWRMKLPEGAWRRFSMPNVTPPALPNVGTPAGPPIGASARWLLFVGILGLTAWLLIGWARRSAAKRDHRDELGPWPIQPQAVATRVELVQAFDYLALLTLGMRVKSWNHQAVAKRWKEGTPAQSGVADALARLYEQARYTDGPPVLSESQRDLARHSLVQLAEAF